MFDEGCADKSFNISENLFWIFENTVHELTNMISGNEINYKLSFQNGNNGCERFQNWSLWARADIQWWKQISWSMESLKHHTTAADNI